MNTKPISAIFAIIAVLAILSTSVFSVHAAPAGVGSPTNPQGGETVPSQITYQGRLTTNTGALVNWPVAATFRIYDQNSLVIWKSADRTIVPTNGLFTEYLGISPDPELTPAILVYAASIGVSVGGDAEMTPRQPINTLVGHSVDGPGIVASSQTGIGLVAYSQTDQGLNASSVSGPAIYATSSGSDGNHAAIHANNTQASGGVAGYFTNNSDFSTANFTNSGSGQVLYLKNSNTGAAGSGGPFIQSANKSGSVLFQVDGDGDISQDPGAFGVAKAAANVVCNSSDSMMNGYTSAYNIPITISNGSSLGTCRIHFGFPVTTRFFSISTHNTYTTSWCGPAINGVVSDLDCSSTAQGIGASQGIFTIIIF